MAITALATLASGVTYTAAAGFAFSMTMGTFLTNLALGAALKALSPKPSIAGANRGYQTTAIGTALDHQIIYGKMRVGGARIYDEATGDTNEYLHRIIAVAGHEITSFDRIYINDSYVDFGDIDEGGNVSTVTDADGSSSDRYDGHLRINFHLGSPDQTVDTDLETESAHWTNTCRLRGIAYMYIRMKYNADVYPDGIPEFTAVVKGKKVYDPRTSTTAYTDNPALCLRDYLTASYGVAEDTANIDDALVTTAANVCDQTNTIAGTTRYTCNGSFTTSVTPYDMINNMLTSMDGSLWYAQGSWRMKPAYWTAPVLDLNEDDLRSNISVSTRHSRRNNFNTVKGTFRGEESNWQTTDYPQVNSPAAITADNEQVSTADVDLPFTDNSIEARRIARISLDRNRQQLVVSASFGLKTLQVQVGDNIRLTNSRFGWTNKEFEVVSWNFGLTDGLDLQTQMTLRETAESVYDEVDDGEAYERDNTTLPDPFSGLAVTNLVVSGGGRTQGDGTFINSAILSWTAATSSFVSHYDIEWKALSDSSYSSTTTPNTTIELSPLVDNIEYIFRVRAVSINGVKGAFVTAQFTGGGDVTAPGLPTAITADGGFRYITVSWTNPADSDLNFVEIWENTSNSTVGATKVGVSGGDEFIRSNLGIQETRYYFLKSVDYSGNTSAFTTGVSATTTFIDDDDFANGVYSLFTDQGLYAIEDVTSLPASGDFEGQKVFNRTDGKLYQWTGSVWEQVVGGAEDFSDLTGAIAGAQIPDGLIDTLKLANDAVTNAKIATNAVTSDVIASGAITETKISSGAITTPKIAAGAVTASEIAAGSITSSQIAADTIAAGNIATGAITADEIASNAITSAKITAGAILGDKIAANAITGAKIAAGEITGDKITANTITGGLIAASGIITNSAQITDGVVTNAKIENAAITSAKIQDLAVTSAKIGSLSADKITAGTLDVARLPGIGVAGATTVDSFFNTSGTVNVTVSFSGVTTGSSMIAVITGRFGMSKSSPQISITPVGTNVTLAHTQSTGGFVSENSSPITPHTHAVSATATSTSGSLGFTLSGTPSGNMYYRVAVSLLTFKA